MNEKRIRRINVICTSGSGKSLLVCRIAETIGLPYIEIDKLFWRPNWVMPSDEEFFADVKRAVLRSWTRQELWEGTGNRESFHKSFFCKESILLWTRNTQGLVRKRNEKLLAGPRYSHIRFVRLRSHGEAEAFLRSSGIA